MNWEARAKELQKQFDDLEFRFENLQSALEQHDTPYLAGLTATETKVGQFLREISPRVATKTAILDAVYAFRHDDELPEMKIVDVFICKLRAKLEVYKIKIETVWGRGYSMSWEAAQKWDQAAGKAAT